MHSTGDRPLIVGPRRYLYESHSVWLRSKTIDANFSRVVGRLDLQMPDPSEPRQDFDRLY